jgi:hypothetical protein
MSSFSALVLASPSGAIVSVPNASTAAGLSALSSLSVRLDAHNFMLWRGITVPALAGAGLHGHLDGTAVAPSKTIKQGTGDAAVDVPNPEYSRWWVMDQRVLSFLLGSHGAHHCLLAYWLHISHGHMGRLAPAVWCTESL